MNITDIINTEVELYFKTTTDRNLISDIGGIVYNFIVKYNPSATETREFVYGMYSKLTNEKI